MKWYDLPSFSVKMTYVDSYLDLQWNWRTFKLELLEFRCLNERYLVSIWKKLGVSAEKEENWLASAASLHKE